MQQSARTSPFFKAGGTLDLKVPSYITRSADEELWRHAKAGHFCYVLTPRQMGKSSLMVRTAARLQQVGIRVAIVDLSALGTIVTKEQWYLGIVQKIASELSLSVDSEAWWQENAAFGAVQRFTDFLQEVLQVEIEEPIVIFLDEIDSTLKLDFTDDFFAAIRFMHNLRANNPDQARLTFVLLGVAAPSDLIKDRQRTPFNIGYAITLKEFSRVDVEPLEVGLRESYASQEQRILDRIFYWTNGHPYLTQKLCLEISEASAGLWQDEQIDALVERLFLTEEAQNEGNLRFVRSQIEASPERGRLLRLYRKVWRGEEVIVNERSQRQNRLRLIGLVHNEKGILHVRNQIYRRVFNLAWIKENTALDRTQLVIIGTGVTSLLLVIFLLIYSQLQHQAQVDFVTDRFLNNTNPGIKLSYLSDLCVLDQQAAQYAFFKNEKQPRDFLLGVKLLGVKDKNPDKRLVRVVNDCLAPYFVEKEGEEDVFQAMCYVLSKIDLAECQTLSQKSKRACHAMEQSK